jgi:16S rRNA (cytosine1402-N4)-methyltransferase
MGRFSIVLLLEHYSGLAHLQSLKACNPVTANPSLDPNPFHHIPVLKLELLEGLNLWPQGVYLDATLGGGGHSQGILEGAAQTQVWGIDRDQIALAAAQAKLADYGDRLQFWHGNFAQFQPGELRFDGIIADLGVNSMQLDQPERGFSFRHEANLDMRMDQSQPLTAAEMINHWQETQLADLFFEYGEERFSRRIARSLVAQRPFHTTTQLAAAIAQAVPGKYRHGRIHPATRVFQALRIAVNQELEALETFLHQAPSWLKPQGRIAIISFHSLEDRLVKHRFKDHDLLRVVTKKPIVAQDLEVKQNPRSRSAKLRLAERLA